MRFGALAVIGAAVFSGASLPGQSIADSQDPAGAVRRIARQVEEEMQQIDLLLGEASRPPGSEDRLATASETQDRVIRGIDELLDQLHEFCCTCPGGT